MVALLFGLLLVALPASTVGISTGLLSAVLSALLICTIKRTLNASSTDGVGLLANISPVRRRPNRHD